MTLDANLEVRTDAFFVFKGITNIKADALNNYGADKWWSEHRKDFVK